MARIRWIFDPTVRRRRRRALLPTAPLAGGQSIPLGQVLETETAQPFTASKQVALGQVLETETAQAVTASKQVALGQVLETETAQAVTSSKTVALGQPAETELAQPFTASKPVALGQPAEAELAQPFTASKTVALGQVVETELAQPFTVLAPQFHALGQAVETETAQPFSVLKTVALGQGTPAEEFEYLPAHEQLLAFAPPDGWESYTTQNVPTGGGTITLTAGQDYKLVMPSSPVTKRIRVQNGRNVVLMGGEIDIDTAHATLDDRNALWFEDQTGIIHVEGLYAHGDFLNDGIKTFAENAIHQVVNTHIGELHGTDAGYHSDGIQCVEGFRELRIDKWTCYSQYQGLMFKSDGLPSGRWLKTDLRRVNFGQFLTPDSVARTLNFITGGPATDQYYCEGPIYLHEVYLQPRTTALSSSIAPAAWFTFSGSGGSEIATPNSAGWVGTNPKLRMVGRILEGLPAGGDFVPAASVGIGYKSPGYFNLLVRKAVSLGQVLETELAQPFTVQQAGQAPEWTVGAVLIG